MYTSYGDGGERRTRGRRGGAAGRPVELIYTETTGGQMPTYEKLIPTYSERASAGGIEGRRFRRWRRRLRGESVGREIREIRVVSTNCRVPRVYRRAYMSYYYIIVCARRVGRSRVRVFVRADVAPPPSLLPSCGMTFFFSEHGVNKSRERPAAVVHRSGGENIKIASVRRYRLETR